MEQRSDASLPYHVKRSRRARQVRISVHCDAGVIVTAPVRFPASMIAQFVEQQLSWIHHALVELHSKRQNWVQPEHVRTESYTACRARAKQFIRDRINVYNAHYEFSYRRISVKNLKSRWGSCSKEKNLNFHYRLLFLPVELADYVIVHELCHLKELNHSKKFWQLVAQTVGDYKQKKRALHNYSFSSPPERRSMNVGD